MGFLLPRNFWTVVLTSFYLFFASFFCTLPFEISDYENKIELHASELVLGETQTKRDARDKAVAVWIELYGDIIRMEWPYSVYLDEENDAWLVKGTLATPFPRILSYWFATGTEPYIIIQRSDGKVLAVWRG